MVKIKITHYLASMKLTIQAMAKLENTKVSVFIILLDIQYNKNNKNQIKWKQCRKNKSN